MEGGVRPAAVLILAKLPSEASPSVKVAYWGNGTILRKPSSCSQFPSCLLVQSCNPSVSLRELSEHSSGKELANESSFRFIKVAGVH